MTHKHVFAIGVFDLFHIGHLRYLQFARAQGLRLTVGVTPDHIVLATKHKLPIINEQQRVEIIGGLGWVDSVRLLPSSTEDTDTASAWIAEWGVDHVVVGGEWQNKARWNRLIPQLAAKNISVEFAPHTDEISTTKIIASLFEHNNMMKSTA